MIQEQDHGHNHGLSEEETNGPVGIELVDITEEPSGITKITAEIPRYFSNLEMQSMDLAARFAGKLGLSEEEYIRTLPKFGQKPRTKNFNGELVIPAVPVLVDPRVEWDDLLTSITALDKDKKPRAVKPRVQDHRVINAMFDLKELEDWKEGGRRTSSEPYATWLKVLPDTSAEEIRANLGRNERVATVRDTIALYHQQPQILNRFYLIIPGSQIGPDFVAVLSALRNAESSSSTRESIPNHPSLYKIPAGSKSPRYACVVASSIRI